MVRHAYDRRRLIPGIAWLLLASLPCPLTGQQPVPASLGAPLEIEELARRGRPSTVTVLAIDRAGTPTGLGSGVVIRDGKTVLTNWHVLRGASRAVVITADGSKYSDVSFLEGDSKMDIALLTVRGGALTPVPMTVDIPPPGARVLAIGAPRGLMQTVSDGIVSATRTYRNHLLVQITAPISPGSSGGPVFDKYGRVFAIATSGIVDGQALNFATPIRYAVALLPLATAPRSINSVFSRPSR